MALWPLAGSWLKGHQKLQTKVGAVAVAKAAALAVVNYLPIFVIDKCPQAPLGEITILRPDSAELPPAWLAALLKQQKQGVVALRH